MKGMQILFKIAEEHDGIIETKVAEKNGVSRATLSTYNRLGKIQRISYGKYSIVEEKEDILHFIGNRSKQYVFSHETALFLHGIITELPVKPSVTIASGKTPSIDVRSLAKIFFIKKELFELGKIEMPTEHGNPVFVYDMERTIIDMIRSRRRVGKDMVFQSLRAYNEKPDKDMKKILQYAEAFRMEMKFCGYWNEISQEVKGS
ncbi:MAG: hypothetical protein IKT73_09960 [Anaerotignum sp.]|nr:hypothetical protein [Anaerotignum sp.]